MDSLLAVLKTLCKLIPAAGVIIGTAFLIHLVQRLNSRRASATGKHGIIYRIILILIVFGGVIGIVITLPIDNTMRSSLTALIGIVISAALTLGSTTFVANAMAGFMVRAVRNFKIGDFIRVGEHFGRVSEQGLFHTEIQTDKSNLTTLPNLYLVSNPVTVVRESGTVVGATVSLGYDVAHELVEQILREAVEESGLSEPFVQILQLGDFSISYKAAGLLAEPKKLLAKQSELRSKMLDLLHKNNIEIVSPNFMNQRVLPVEKMFIPSSSLGMRAAAESIEKGPRSDIVFGKAEQAEIAEELRKQLDRTREKIDSLTRDVESVEKPSESIKAELERKKIFEVYLANRLKAVEMKIKSDNE